MEKPICLPLSQQVGLFEPSPFHLSPFPFFSKGLEHSSDLVYKIYLTVEDVLKQRNEQFEEKMVVLEF